MTSFTGLFESEQELQAAILAHFGATVEEELVEWLEDSGEMIIYMDRVEEMFQEALDDEGEVIIGASHYYRSDILKEIDPISYRCGLHDYRDSLSEDFIVLDY